MRRTILFIIGAIILGRAIYICFLQPKEVIAWPENKIEVFGYVDDYPSIGILSNRYRLRIEKVNDVNVKEKSRIIISTSPQTELVYGEEIVVYGKIENPENFTTDSGVIFDYENYLRLNNIYGITKNADIKTKGRNKGNKITAILFNIRKSFAEQIDYYMPIGSANLSRGVLLGEKVGISPELRNNLQITSTSHIIALSGFNITILVKSFTAITKYLPMFIRSIFAGIGIIVFIIMTGSTSSTIRAGIMASILLYAEGRGKKYNALWALTLALSIMLATTPLALLADVGLHLSVLATFGIIVFEKPITLWLKEKLFKKVKIPKIILEAMSSSTSASIMVMPYIAWKMGIISFIGIPVNILIVPMVAPLMLLAFATGLIPLLFSFLPIALTSLLATSLGFATHILAQIMLGIINTGAGIPYASASVPNLSLFIVIPIYLYLFYRARKILLDDRPI